MSWTEVLHQKRVDAFHIGGRVLGQTALGQQGLVEQDVRQVVEMHRAVELFDQRVLGIDFQDGLDFGCGLPSLLEHARQLGGHAVVLDDQAGG